MTSEGMRPGLRSAAALAVVAAATQTGGPRLVLQPPVVTRTETATVVVTGVGGEAPAIRLLGATDGGTRLRGWQRLHPVEGGWAGTVTPPALDGIYPIRLRIEGRVARNDDWLLRVFPDGTSARPSFATPEEVAVWWVRTVAHGDLVALRPWRRPDFDRRDGRLHRLFVVAYSRPGRPAVQDRLGMFVTAVRDGFHGRWRLLEASTLP